MNVVCSIVSSREWRRREKVDLVGYQFKFYVQHVISHQRKYIGYQQDTRRCAVCPNVMYYYILGSKSVALIPVTCARRKEVASLTNPCSYICALMVISFHLVGDTTASFRRGNANPKNGDPANGNCTVLAAVIAPMRRLYARHIRDGSSEKIKNTTGARLCVIETRNRLKPSSNFLVTVPSMQS